MEKKQMEKNEIKKIFTKYGNINFFEEYTLQDLEDAKKRYYFAMCKDGHNNEHAQKKIDEMAHVLISEKFNPNTPSLTVGSIVKNTVKDNLNPIYKNTTKRLINLDSQYRPNIYPYQTNYTSTSTNNTSETNYIAHLTEKLDNVVSLQIENLQIPYTFYNIEAKQGNNRFTVDNNLIIVPNGHYTLSTLRSMINSLISEYRMVLSFIEPSYKTLITNNLPDSTDRTITFYSSANDNEYTKYNNNLGWILGFRNIHVSDTISMTYTINVDNTLTSEAIPCINDTKYIVIVVDEFNKNITNGTLVQTKLETCTIKPTTYWNYQDTTKCLLDASCSNIDNYSGLTKAQLYSQAQFNANRVKIDQQVLRLDCNTPNNILGIVPFESKTAWGDYYLTDKIDYKREYHGPIEIEKLQIQLFNDKGFPLTFNGLDWYITLSSEHLYKY